MTQEQALMAPGPAPLVVQHLVLPDPAISTETDLFVHLEGPAVLRLAASELVFAPGGVARFDSYMNLLNLGNWQRHCALDGLWLRLAGEGRFGLRIWQCRGPRRDETTVFEEVVTLTPEGADFDLTALAAPAAGGGLVMVALTALSEGRLSRGAFVTRAPRDAAPLHLMVSITTFRREAEVAQTLARMTGFLDGPGAALLAAAGARVDLCLVDNGQSASPAPHPRLRVIPNANLGGAGGFARGLAAAQDSGATHCLFMDDDASFQLENLVRSLAFLRLARSPRAALAGAMISAGRKWAMWENGAVFDRFCRPQHLGVDLRKPKKVAAMELAASGPRPAGFYGGWWYFAFPVAEVTRYPFPFFVRGDDISFSLAHGFDTATINGVVSFQEDFSAKESPLTLYLDLRNHLHHHLVHPQLEIGAAGTAKIALRFLLRSVVRMHYDSAEAQLMAWEDVMRGPDFFAANADMSARRPEVLALIRDEAWVGTDPAHLAPPPELSEPGPVKSRLMKWTLNGHLLPFWGRLGAHHDVPIHQRGLLWSFWGARAVRMVDAEAGRSYEVRHDKRRFASIMARAARLAWRWRRDYPALMKAHRAGYDRLTRRAFWEGKFLPDTSRADATAQEDPAATLPRKAGAGAT